MQKSFLGVLAVVAVVLSSLITTVPASAETQKQQAKRWGRIHAAAIYCGIEDAHDFGVSAMEYYKAQGTFKAMREIYGLALLNAAREAPDAELGGNCEGLEIIFYEVWEFFKKKTPKKRKVSR